jgi:predicted ATPase
MENNRKKPDLNSKSNIKSTLRRAAPTNAREDSAERRITAQRTIHLRSSEAVAYTELEYEGVRLPYRY